MDTIRPTKNGDSDYSQDATSQVYPSMGAQQHNQLQGTDKSKGSPASSSGGPSSEATNVSGYEGKQKQPLKGDNVRASGQGHGDNNVAKKAGAKTTGEEDEEKDAKKRGNGQRFEGPRWP